MWGDGGEEGHRHLVAGLTQGPSKDEGEGGGSGTDLGVKMSYRSRVAARIRRMKGL
jgi:hypothetical protein